MLFDFSYKLDSGEKPVALIRRHWFLAVPKLLEYLIIIALLIVFANKFLIFRNSLAVSLVLIIAYIIYIVYIWVLWRIDYFIITTKRIIRINQKGVWNRNLNEIHYSEIADISMSEEGATAAFFKFGSINIGLANGTKFVIPNVSNPTKVYQGIIKLKELEK